MFSLPHTGNPDHLVFAYPLLSPDMIAIPDFPAKALENWGLITYKETALLYDKDVSTAKNQQHVSVVISHELAHQVL